MELYHHGIKGMHWGIRRTAEQLGHVVSKFHQKRKEKKDLVKERKHPKKVADMTDDELRTHISRLKMEKEYYQLTKELYPSKKNFAEQLISTSIGKFGNVVISSLSDYGANKIKKALSQSEPKRTLSDIRGLDLDKLTKKELSEYNDMTKYKNTILGIKNPDKNKNNNKD